MRTVQLRATTYVVLARDANRNLWRLSSFRGQIIAVQLPTALNSDHAIMHSAAAWSMTRPEFYRLHKLLTEANAPTWWANTERQYGIMLDPTSVMYRELHLSSTPMALRPPSLEVKAPHSSYVRITGSTLHRKTNSIELVGATNEPQVLAAQVFKEMVDVFKLTPNYTFGKLEHGIDGPRQTVEFHFGGPSDPSQWEIRKYLINKFR